MKLFGNSMNMEFREESEKIQFDYPLLCEDVRLLSHFFDDTLGVSNSKKINEKSERMLELFKLIIFDPKSGTINPLNVRLLFQKMYGIVYENIRRIADLYFDFFQIEKAHLKEQIRMSIGKEGLVYVIRSYTDVNSDALY